MLNSPTGRPTRSNQSEEAEPKENPKKKSEDKSAYRAVKVKPYRVLKKKFICYQIDFYRYKFFLQKP